MKIIRDMFQILMWILLYCGIAIVLETNGLEVPWHTGILIGGAIGGLVASHNDSKRL